MMPLSKEQKKIIYIGLILVCALLLFITFIYLPQQRRLGEIRAELVRTEQQVKQTHLIRAGRDLNEAVRDLNLKLQRVSAYLLIGEEEVVNSLSTLAKKENIDILDLGPGGKELFNSVTPGYEVYALPIALNIRGGYREIGEYCANIESDFPALVRADKLVIRRGRAQDLNLDARLEITAFLLKER